MDYQLDDNQRVLLSALQTILADHADLPQAARLTYAHYHAGLQTLLAENGFLHVGRDLGPLEAALVTIEAATIPSYVEVAGSALILPQLLPQDDLTGPIALLNKADLSKPHRNLPIAGFALVDMDEDAAVLAIDPAAIEPVETILAYPYGRFREMPDLSRARILPGAGPLLRQWWRVALCAEFAGAVRAAVAFTVDYVKQRKVLGKPVGAYQVVQHRLVQCHQIGQALHYLTLRAAWSGTARDASLAATYAQHHVQKLLFDLHQFNGAMGVTTEHLLHFWTYRLRALQAEAGGVSAAALDVATHLWGAVPEPRTADAPSPVKHIAA